MKKLLTSALFIFCYNCLAADWYQIEVIAFEYIHPNQDEVELWDPHPGEPDWKAGINLTDEATAKIKRKQQEAATAAAAPPPAPAPAPTPATVDEHTNEYADNEDSSIEPVPAPKPQTPPPAAPAQANTEPSGEKFVSVEEILTGQHDQSAPATAPPANQSPLAFVSLPASQYTMGDIEKKLHKQGTYKILTHTAWRQPAFTGNTNEGVHVFGGRLLDHEGPVGARYEFEGLVSLRSTRYLHLDVDALLRETQAKELGSKYDSPADLGLLESSNSGHDRMPVYQVYRLSQSQRVRANKVYYFDHPLMGLIIKVSPYGA